MAEEMDMRTPVSADLQVNRALLKRIFRLPRNGDCKLCLFRAAGRGALLCYLDGMCDAARIDEDILRPAKLPLAFSENADAASVARDAFALCDCETTGEMRAAVSAVLLGKCAVFIDGCEEAVLADCRKPEKRAVGRTVSENVVIGPQEGFTESLRTNLTLLRRIVRSERLVSETFDVGTELPTAFSLVYLDGRADEAVLSEVRRRMKNVDAPFVPGTGFLQQLIEDHPRALFAQMLQTERPDRASACLAEGRVAILGEGSPYALIAPITLFHLLHAPDDRFLRAQYGTFLRLVRFLGIVISLYLPAVYTAISLYHTHILPTSLFTSIAEARARVPFPVIVEVLIMEISFLLINEAGTRIPSQIGPALGIVGALILGQAAVSASIISPIMIIIVALTGLGNYAIPDYGLGVAVQMLRFGMLLCGAVWGLYGVVLFTMALTASLCGMRSFGETYLSPAAPSSRRMELLLRRPMQERKDEAR